MTGPANRVEAATVVAKMRAIGSELVRVADVVAPFIDRKMFRGRPPRAVTYAVLHREMARLTREPMKKRSPELDPDLILWHGSPPGSLTTRELFLVTGEAMTLGADHLEQAPPDPDGIQAELTDWIAQMFLWTLVGVAQATGAQLEVVELAKIAEMETVPFPMGMKRSGKV